MFGRHPAHADPLLDGIGWQTLTDPSVPSRSCCCPARPMVKVIMPPAPGRPDPVDLWLCGHHYRASRAALLAAGADVEDLTMPYHAGDELVAGAA